ncbi:MAG: HAMP domain-containing histidine kinase [Chitinophagaceae bacterium]|nr:HAMP domain-containing histidine kinase [Chitinophagaceae bacterium]
MKFFKTTEWRILSRVLGLFITITITCLIIIKGWYVYLVIALPVIIAQLVDFYKLQRKAHDELGQFVESVHYRDFSRYFDVKHAPVDLQPLRQGFNDINTTIKDISRERETQYQYLQKILELIDTGILMYREDDGTVVWMNEALKQMLQLPYLKTIHSLKRRDAELYEQVSELKPGDSKIGTAHLEKSPFKVLLSATAFNTDSVKYKLVAFQNVNEALDETESKAWQKLLSVMTHEIMNSIAPISSLAATLKGRLQESARQLDNSTGVLDDLELGIDTIKRRSEGLLKFAETYRNLNKITTPNLKKVYVRDLFENLHLLMQPTLQAKKIEVEVILKDPDLMLDADTNLVEQVLINLLVNAIEAVKDVAEPHIILSAYLASNRRTVIRISDNGTGMSEEVQEKIFIPFFSTKKSGSGIGLSLCKQIMMLHRGHIQVQSAEGEGTAFILQF